MKLSVAEIAQRIDAEVVGDSKVEITGLGSLGTASVGQLSHLSNSSYRNQLADTNASAVILSAADAAQCPVCALVVDNPYLAFAKASQLFADPGSLAPGIHPSAIVGQGCEIDAAAAIGPGVVIGDSTQVAAGARIFAHSVLGDRCSVGEDVTVRANVTVYNDVSIGPRSVLHSGCVIGADGFGFAPDSAGHLVEIAQLGGVEIGADVSVGACTSIDCGAIENTVIEDGVKIDNQVQIGHNCRVGAHSLLCGCVGLAGSSVIGKHCVLAGGVGVGGDKPVTLCDGVTATAYTAITQSVSKPGVYSGSIVFHEHGKWRRNALRFLALDELFKRVKAIETRSERD
jgi:UDP-3-O-[3-hydroxymyristoyl] glucosamine N-acyltransferase